MYEDATCPKVSSAGYSLWMAVMSLLITGLALLAVRKRLKAPNLKAVLYSVGGGALSRIANFLLLIALAVLPASVQYPFVTGGVIIVSTLIAALTSQKPSKKEIFAVCLSFIGIILLVLIPI